MKVINPAYVDSYLDGSFMNFNDGKINGCITTVEGASGLKTPRDFYEGLRLDYEGTPFSPLDSSATVIRFTSNDAGKFHLETACQILQEERFLPWRRHLLEMVLPQRQMVKLYLNFIVMEYL